MNQESQVSLKLQRHLLSSIDLEDINQQDLSEQERKDYCAAIFAIYPRLEKDIKIFLKEQLLFQGKNAENWEQILFSRGTINGLSLLLDNWERAKGEYEASLHRENSELKEF